MKIFPTIVAATLFTATANAATCGATVFDKYNITEKHQIQTVVPQYCTEVKDDLSSYAAPVPFAQNYPLLEAEQKALERYLEDINDVKAVKTLALFHLERSLVVSAVTGEAVRHSILADYFLTRLKTLKNDIDWILATKTDNENMLTKTLKSYDSVSIQEDRPAQAFYIDTFNYHEQNRHTAIDALLDEIAINPNIVYTSFLIMAGNLWAGGEADYADPAVLYNFVIGSFFGEHTMALAKQQQQTWKKDPTQERFRLASIIGGIDVMHRLWLANLHQNKEAKLTLDEEHRQWFKLNPVFHAFTVGLSQFEQDDTFQEAYDAWEIGMTACDLRDDLRTCTNRPRFSYNMLGFALGWVDFLLKKGELEQAGEILNWKYAPHLQYENWDLGQPAWEHRIKNLAEISALYLNDDLSDDPMPFNLKKRKWGVNTSTCQGCHQAQNRSWSEDEKQKIMLPPEDILTLDNFPVRTTSWNVL